MCSFPARPEKLKLARLMAVLPVDCSLGLGPLDPTMTGRTARSEHSSGVSGGTSGSGIHSSTSSSTSYIRITSNVRLGGLGYYRLTFSVNWMKWEPFLSARVRDCIRVRIANKSKKNSRSVRPGSFWCELLIYRRTTAEPGILVKVVWAVVREYSSNEKTGVRVSFMVVQCNFAGCHWVRGALHNANVEGFFKGHHIYYEGQHSNTKI